MTVEKKPKKSGIKQASKPVKKLLAGGADPAVGKATQFKPGQSGNPAGKPKGTVHLSTHIQNLLNDETFRSMVRQGLEIREYKGAPIKAIIQAQINLALNGDAKAFDLLAKYGYGSKIELTGPDGGPVRALVEFVGDGASPSKNSSS